jgi:hypothetical protein
MMKISPAVPTMSDAARAELEIRLAAVMSETARLALDAQHDPYEHAALRIRADALRRRIGALNGSGAAGCRRARA